MLHNGGRPLNNIDNKQTRESDSGPRLVRTDFFWRLFIARESPRSEMYPVASALAVRAL